MKSRRQKLNFALCPTVIETGRDLLLIKDRGAVYDFVVISHE
jgi:hypothetical protein